MTGTRRFEISTTADPAEVLAGLIERGVLHEVESTEVDATAPDHEHSTQDGAAPKRRRRRGGRGRGKAGTSTGETTDSGDAPTGGDSD